MPIEHIWVVANWKSNKTVKEALEWIGIVGPRLSQREDIKVVICPPFIDLAEVKKAVVVGNFPLIIGSQDLSPFGEGSFTGEEAASLVKHFADISIIGHSERRTHFSETDQMVEKKFEQAKINGIIPLVCVQNEQTPIPEGCKLAAYEPVFAIGTGNPDTPENADAVAGTLKNKIAQDLEVLYGGSVNSQNAHNFIRQKNISGLLIGKASLDAEEFLKIIEECMKY